MAKSVNEAVFNETSTDGLRELLLEKSKLEQNLTAINIQTKLGMIVLAVQFCIGSFITVIGVGLVISILVVSNSHKWLSIILAFSILFTGIVLLYFVTRWYNNFKSSDGLKLVMMRIMEIDKKLEKKQKTLIVKD